MTTAVISANAKTTKLNRRQVLLASVTGAAVVSLQPPALAAPAEQGHELGTVWWNELLTSDIERARAFYSDVAGWTPKVVALEEPSRPPKAGEKEYVLFSSNGRETAGAMRREDAEFGRADAAMWLPYIHVADVDSAAFRAVQLGGKLLSEPTDIPDLGRIAVVADLDGARIGLITPLRGAK